MMGWGRDLLADSMYERNQAVDEYFGLSEDTVGFDELEDNFEDFFRKRGKSIMADQKNLQVHTPIFRVSFPSIKKKGEMSKKFEITMLFEEGTDLSDLKRAAVKALKKKWTEKPNGFQTPFKDAGKKEYDGYEAGMTYVVARSQRRPGVVDKHNNLVDLEEIDSVLYGGCYARAVIQAFPYDTAGNRGVSFEIQAIQIVKDGEPFGSSVDATRAFDPVDDDDDDDDDFDTPF